jgi:hypothetical protein
MEQGDAVAPPCAMSLCRAAASGGPASRGQLPYDVGFPVVWLTFLFNFTFTAPTHW